MAYDFNATSTKIDSTLATNSTTRSWSIWAYREGDGEGGEGRFWEKDGERLFWPSSDAGVFFFGDWTGNDRHAVWSGTSATNGWHNIIVTFDSSSTANDPILYWDGAVATMSGEQQQTGTKVTGASVHTIGNNAAQSNTFDGRLCEFAVWDRILTPAEAASIGKGFSPLFYPASLVEYLPLIRNLSSYKLGVATATDATAIEHPRIIYPSSYKFAPQAAAAGSSCVISLDAISSGRNSSGDITVSHTTGSGTNRYLIAVTTAQDSNHANMPVNSIKWNGTDLTKVRHDEPAGNVRTEIWYLINPASGTFNLVADFAGNVGEATLGAITLTGAEQVAPEANNGATGTNASPSVSLTTVADLAWSITVAVAEANFTAVNNSQTVLTGYPLTDQSYESADAARREITPAGATTLGYSISSGQAWAISAVSVAPAPCGSASPIVGYKTLLGAGF